MTYVPQDGDVVVARFPVQRKRRGETVTVQREVFGEVQRMTPKRVLVDTLRMGFLSFSRVEVWVPRQSVVLGTLEQHEKWLKAVGDCNSLVRAFREAYVSEKEGEATP